MPGRVGLALGVLVATLCALPAVEPAPPASEGDTLVVRMRPPRWRTPAASPPADDYKVQLISLILDKTVDTHGPFRIRTIDTTVQTRIFELMDDDAVDVIITMTSREREERLIPIRIPVYKGLYGWRVLAIRAKDQPRFDQVETLEQLGALWAGQGRDWPDTLILEANGLQVDTAARWDALYRMLAAERIDYLPRGAHEPWLELEELEGAAAGLVVEEGLALYYPAPGYIFVARHNRPLARRLEKGFRMALADGSFDRLFQGHVTIRECLDRARLGQRRVLSLENPLLSPETPLDQARLWFRP